MLDFIAPFALETYLILGIAPKDENLGSHHAVRNVKVLIDDCLHSFLWMISVGEPPPGIRHPV